MQGLTSTLVVVIGKFGASRENTIEVESLNARDVYPRASLFATSEFKTNCTSVIGQTVSRWFDYRLQIVDSASVAVEQATKPAGHSF